MDTALMYCVAQTSFVATSDTRMPALASHTRYVAQNVSYRGIVTCAFMIATILPAHARQASPPKVIRDAVANGVKVVKTFPAASGLTGWVLNENGTYSVAYTTPDKRTLILGNLINEDGENLSDSYAEKYFPKPGRTALFDQLGQSAYVIEGEEKKPKSVVYIFADANNPNCRYLWKALQPYQRIGLQVRWLPTALPGSSSMPKAIAMLTGVSPGEVFGRDRDDTGTLGPVTQLPPTAVNSETVIRVRKNNALMEAFSVTSVPAIVWKDRAGKVHVERGVPRLSDIPKITGLPPQPFNDQGGVKHK